MESRTINVEVEITVRKYEVDTERLIQCLQKHKKFSSQEIAEKLHMPKTLVEHWFRKDRWFTIPDADKWLELKDLLGIDTDEFDKSIMTFEQRGGGYDMRNRIYIGDISPTLTGSSCNGFYLLRDK